MEYVSFFEIQKFVVQVKIDRFIKIFVEESAKIINGLVILRVQKCIDLVVLVI